MGRVVEITELALRDAHQSLLATRMALDDMTPACEDIDNAGYWSVECWGGAMSVSQVRSPDLGHPLCSLEAEKACLVYYV